MKKMTILVTLILLILAYSPLSLVRAEVTTQASEVQHPEPRPELVEG